MIEYGCDCLRQGRTRNGPKRSVDIAVDTVGVEWEGMGVLMGGTLDLLLGNRKIRKSHSDDIEFRRRVFRNSTGFGKIGKFREFSEQMMSQSERCGVQCVWNGTLTQRTMRNKI